VGPSEIWVLGCAGKPIPEPGGNPIFGGMEKDVVSELDLESKSLENAREEEDITEGGGKKTR
jgi:hypothetical protein